MTHRSTRVAAHDPCLHHHHVHTPLSQNHNHTTPHSALYSCSLNISLQSVLWQVPKDIQEPPCPINLSCSAAPMLNQNGTLRLIWDSEKRRGDPRKGQNSIKEHYEGLSMRGARGELARYIEAPWYCKYLDNKKIVSASNFLLPPLLLYLGGIFRVPWTHPET